MRTSKGQVLQNCTDVQPAGTTSNEDSFNRQTSDAMWCCGASHLLSLGDAAKESHRRNYRHFFFFDWVGLVAHCRWGPTMVRGDIPKPWAKPKCSSLTICQQCYFYRVILENQTALHLSHKGIPPLLTLNKPTTSCISLLQGPLISKVVFTPALAFHL